MTGPECELSNVYVGVAQYARESALALIGPS